MHYPLTTLSNIQHSNLQINELRILASACNVLLTGRCDISVLMRLQTGTFVYFFVHLLIELLNYVALQQHCHCVSLLSTVECMVYQWSWTGRMMIWRGNRAGITWKVSMGFYGMLGNPPPPPTPSLLCNI